MSFEVHLASSVGTKWVPLCISSYRATLMRDKTRQASESWGVRKVVEIHELVIQNSILGVKKPSGLIAGTIVLTTQVLRCDGTATCAMCSAAIGTNHDRVLIPQSHHCPRYAAIVALLEQARLDSATIRWLLHYEKPKYLGDRSTARHTLATTGWRGWSEMCIYKTNARLDLWGRFMFGQHPERPSSVRFGIDRKPPLVHFSHYR